MFTIAGVIVVFVAAGLLEEQWRRRSEAVNCTVWLVEDDSGRSALLKVPEEGPDGKVLLAKQTRQWKLKLVDYAASLIAAMAGLAMTGLYNWGVI